jgi:hypothetical protein
MNIFNFSKNFNSILNECLLENKIIKIQKIIRGYLVRKIPQSQYQTNEWRKKAIWYKNGRHNECEIYQRKLIERITNQKCIKTDYRINMDKLVLKNNDGFEWTENFDGIIEINNIKFYFNMKFICGDGGIQTRSLREVYHFIKYQKKYLEKENNNIYFINILDGDFCYKHIEKIKYNNCHNNIFIGDTHTFQIWWKSKICSTIL